MISTALGIVVVPKMAFEQFGTVCACKAKSLQWGGCQPPVQSHHSIKALAMRGSTFGNTTCGTVALQWPWKCTPLQQHVSGVCVYMLTNPLYLDLAAISLSRPSHGHYMTYLLSFSGLCWPGLLDERHHA